MSTQNQPDYEAQAREQIDPKLGWGKDADAFVLHSIAVRECAARLEAEAELATLKQQLAGATENEQSVVQQETHVLDSTATDIEQKDAVIVSLAQKGQAIADKLRALGLDLNCEEEIAAWSKALADAQAGTVPENAEQIVVTFSKAVRSYLGMERSQREYSWHDVEDALVDAKKTVLAGPKGEAHE